MSNRFWQAAAIVAALTSAAPAVAQSGFTGTWTATRATPASIELAPNAVFGARFAIRESGNALTVIRTLRDGAFEATYELGGAESRVRLPGATCIGDAHFVEIAARDGQAITLTTTASEPPGAPRIDINLRRVFRMVSVDTLLVESTISQGGQPRSVGTLYVRSQDAMPTLFAPLPDNRARATIADAAWVGGVWASEGAVVTEERWTPPAGGVLIGVSRTMRGTGMSAFEFLCVVERGGSLVYSAMPNARSPATDFVLTTVTPDSLTFENPAHDFPTRISYIRRPDGTLETAVSGAAGSRVITSVLKRQ